MISNDQIIHARDRLHNANFTALIPPNNNILALLH